MYNLVVPHMHSLTTFQIMQDPITARKHGRFQRKGMRLCDYFWLGYLVNQQSHGDHVLIRTPSRRKLGRARYLVGERSAEQ